MSVRSYARLLARGAALVAGGAGASLGARALVDRDAGAVRSLRFWRGALPIYAHYRFVEWKHGEDVGGRAEEYAALHRRYAPRVEAITLDLRGFYLKLAQVVSTRDELMAAEYMRWMKKLQDKSPCVMEPEFVRRVVERNLGDSIDAIFSEWDDVPIGAASIGQVHYGILRSTGEEVAVKVQFPEAETTFRSDIATVERFCELFMPQNAPYFKEIKRQFATEFDYRGEADNLREVHDNLYKAGWSKLVAVPRAHMHLCTKEVLVMSYLPGVKLVDGIRAQYRKLAASQGKDYDEVEREQKERIASGEIEKKDLRQSARETARVQRLLALRDWLLNIVIWVGNWTVAPLIRDFSWAYVNSEQPLNLGTILETLLRVHAFEIFSTPAFNGDCHPGNVLLMPDSRLGLLDYGQVKRMKLADRIIFAKLVLALSREDKPEVVRIMTEEIGYRTKNMRSDIIYRAAAFYNCRDSEDILQDLNAQEFMEYIQREDPPVQVNDEFVMVARVSLLLRGLANAFGLKLRVTDYWKHDAAAFLEEQGIPY